MTRPNVARQLQSIPVTLRHLGYAQPISMIQGSDTNGNLCIRLDYTAATWATGNQMVIIRAKGLTVAGIAWPASMTTPSVAPGQFSDGVFSLECAVEDNGTTLNAANEKFMLDVLHVLRGCQMNSVDFWKTANGTQPLFGGFNGAGSDTLGTYVGGLIPGGKIATPGYGS